MLRLAGQEKKKNHVHDQVDCYRWSIVNLAPFRRRTSDKCQLIGRPGGRRMHASPGEPLDLVRESFHGALAL